MTDRDDELAAAIRELTETIEELQDELSPRRRRPPLRPPTPGDLLRFTDEVALPAALTVLKANVRALETFQRGLELVRAEETARERTANATAQTEKRARELRRTTVAQLDTVLEELQRGVSQGSVPEEDRVTDLLEDARDLRDEVDRRLRDAIEGPGDTESQPIEIEDDREESSVDPEFEDEESNVDVEAELETLKDQLRDEDSSVDRRTTDEAGDGETDADDTADADADDAEGATENGDSDDEDDDRSQ